MVDNAGVMLVATKLTAPNPPPRLISRPRLQDALNDALADPAVRVIVVSAPAGSGKSTLLAGWLASVEQRFAWLQADRADHDPARFWTHVVAALSRQLPELEAAVASAITGAARDARPLIERLANFIDASAKPIALVIDDYHLVSDRSVDEAIEQLLDLAPSSFTLVLCSRVDPSLRLSRMRLQGQLFEIRSSALRFATDEASQLLQQQGANPEPHQVKALCERTEGWAAGLVLAAMSMAESTDKDAFVSAFQGNDRLVVDYLTDEFLSGIAPTDRDRFLRTSILHRLNGPLIDALCQSTDGTQWLRETAASNQLLISLDRTDTWFRYHHLLGDLLRVEAENSAEIDLADLHQRAGQWHQSYGSAHDAVEHYTLGGNYGRAVDLIYDEATELLNSGQLGTLQHQIERLGPIADQHAGTAIVNGMIALLSGRLPDAAHYCATARSLGPDEDEIRPLTALGIYIAIARGDVATALEEANQSAPPTESTQALSLGVARVWAGDYRSALPSLHTAQRLSNESNNALVASSTPIFEAIAALESGDDPAARSAADRALSTARAAGWDDLPQSALAHSILGRTSNNPNEAAAAVIRGVDLAMKSSLILTQAYALASAGDVLLHLGDSAGRTHLQAARAAVDRCVDPGIAAQYVSRVEARHGVSVRVPATPEMVEDLTEREFAVLRYLPSQLSQRDIASELYVSLNTVKTHCSAIYRKLGVGNRKAAVQAGRDTGLL